MLDAHQDWTRGPDGRSNNSQLFLDLCDDIERVIRNEAHALINGRADQTARLIVARMAHKHALVPSEFTSGRDSR